MKARNTKFYNRVEKRWLLIDAKDRVLGRLATRISRILQGKDKPQYSPNFLCGDNVVVINAKHIRVTGNKLKDKVYDKYTGYPGGRKEISLEKLMQKNSQKALSLAVKGMLPRNILGKEMFKHLKIYPEDKHPHLAPQQ